MLLSVGGYCCEQSFREFEVGDLVDAKDKVGKWYEAVVRDIKDDRVLIHYNGWPANGTSGRISNLRTCCPCVRTPMGHICQRHYDSPHHID